MQQVHRVDEQCNAGRFLANLIGRRVMRHDALIGLNPVPSPHLLVGESTIAAANFGLSELRDFVENDTHMSGRGVISVDQNGKSGRRSVHGGFLLRRGDNGLSYGALHGIKDA